MNSAASSGEQMSGEFWPSVLAQTQYALQTGALQPIETGCAWIEQGGIRFLVRVLTNLSRKPARPAAPSLNPFLPYEPDLFVAQLSQTHLCLLNKYNVTQHHLLIVTRAFEPQAAPLNWPDFEALWRCMRELELQQIASLGFYNSGQSAGASQPHRHFQLVPLPLAPAQTLPIQVALTGTENRSPMLPFRHALVRLSQTVHLAQTADGGAAELHAAYLLLLDQLALNRTEPAPYNLLVTAEWMLMVPRRQEQFASIAVNALGFAGSLFVKNAAQLEQLEQLGPLSLLTQVACS